jgi:hypothetical protein
LILLTPQIIYKTILINQLKNYLTLQQININPLKPKYNKANGWGKFYQVCQNHNHQIKKVITKIIKRKLHYLMNQAHLTNLY